MDELIQSKKLIKWLVVITVIIILANIFNEIINRASWQIDRFINVYYEGNFPTWFSSMLLAIASYFAYKCSVLIKTKRAGKKMWQLLALGLLGASCDEVAQMHENSGKVINKYFFHIDNLPSQWIVFLGPFLIVGILYFFIKLKRHLRGSYRAVRYLSIGLFVYLGGAFILEASPFFIKSNFWQINCIVKESLEMFGAIFFIKGLMEHYNFLYLQMECRKANE